METYRDWQKRSIGMEKPGNDNQVVLILSGTLQKSQNTSSGELIVSSTGSNMYLVGVGVPYVDDLESYLKYCTEIAVPFNTDNNDIEEVNMPVIARNVYEGYTFLWTLEPIPVSESYREVRIQNNTTIPYVPSASLYLTSTPSESLYEITSSASHSVRIIPQIHSNYYTTDDYNALLGNMSEVAKPNNLYRYDFESNEKYQQYLIDSHKPNCFGGLSVGDISLGLPEGINKHEIARIYIEKLIPRTADTSYHQQVLDLAFFDFRSISASVYADQRISRKNKLKGAVSASIKSVWNNLQENNTEAPKVVYFTEPLNFTLDSGSEGDEYFELEIQTPNSTYPVIGNVVFNVLTSRYVAKYTNAIVYCADNNTAYRTDANGIIVESYPERTYDTVESL